MATIPIAVEGPLNNLTSTTMVMNNGLHLVERISFAHRPRYLRITVVVAVAVLLPEFGSLVLLEIVAVFVIIVP